MISFQQHSCLRLNLISCPIWKEQSLDQRVIPSIQSNGNNQSMFLIIFPLHNKYKMTDYTSDIKNTIKVTSYHQSISLFIGGFIRSGRYGCVYEGIWKLQIPVAAKFFAKTQNPDNQKLQLDATTLIKGTHLVNVYQVTTLYNMNCVIMKKYDGTLRDILKPTDIFKKNQNTKIIFLAAKHIINGLKELEQNGFSHLDLHEGNILYSAIDQLFVIADYSHIGVFSQMGRFKDLVAWVRMMIGAILVESGRKIFQRGLEDSEDFKLMFNLYSTLVPDWLKYPLNLIKEKRQKALISEIAAHLESFGDIQNPNKQILVEDDDKKSASISKVTSIKSIPKNLQKALKARRKPARQQNKLVWCKICLAEFKRKDTRHCKNHPEYVKKSRTSKQ